MSFVLGIIMLVSVVSFINFSKLKNAKAETINYEYLYGVKTRGELKLLFNTANSGFSVVDNNGDYYYCIS